MKLVHTNVTNLCITIELNYTCRNELYYYRNDRGSPDLKTDEMTYVSPIDKETTEKFYLQEVLTCIIVMLFALSTVQYRQVKKLKTQVSNPKIREIE